MSQDLSGCVTFQPASAGSVTLAGLSISAPFVRVDGFTITGGVTYGWDGNAAGGNCDQQLAHDEILSNDTLSGFYVSGVQQVYLVADNVGPTTDSSNNIQPCDPASINNQGAYVNTDHVAVIGSTIHDVTTSNSSGHIEGIHWQDTSYGYVGDSKFLNNDQQDISFHPHGGHDHLDHFLLENNVFDLPSSHHTGGGAGDIGALTWGCDSGTLVDVTVRFNSYHGNDTFDGSFTGGASKCPPIQSYGNILDGPVNDYNCSVNATRITYSHNIFTNAVACGTGNATGNSYASLYKNPGGYDYSLKRGASALDWVPARLPHPRTDINGARRPLRFNSDAGAYQRDPVLIVIGRSIGAVRIGESAADLGTFYGRPRERRVVRLGGQTLNRVTYHVHGRSLWALLDRGTIVGIGTTSPYYSADGGLGVGANPASIRSLRGAMWIDCLRAFRRTFGGVVVYAQPVGRKEGNKLASVVMLRTAYRYGVCEG